MYHSTRGNRLVSATKAIIDGIAEDGGLYIVDKLPYLNYKDMLNDDYVTMASRIIYSFFDDFSFLEILQEVKEAYKSFDIEEVVQCHTTQSNVFFLELWHGPTLAFKDLALVVLPRLMRLAKKKLDSKETTTILTATSGDTGGAALNGFKDIPGMQVVVLYPNEGVSKIQESQMHSFKSKNTEIFAVEGNFDDCQKIVKEFFKENSKLSLSSANSINIGRLIPQIVYYFYSYISLLRSNKIQENEEVNFIVPTGNFGNIFAGFYAKLLGLPIHHLIVASNENDVLTEFFCKGVYNRNRAFHKTNSPSMDILVSSNLERLLYYACDEDVNQVTDLMKQLGTDGVYKFTNPFSFFKAYKTGEEETLECIRKVYEKYQYLIDPHTAVAYGAFLQHPDDDHKSIILSTASPFKFPEVIQQVFGLKEKEEFSLVQEIGEKFNLSIPKSLNYPDVIKKVVSKDNVKDVLKEVIQC